MGENSVLCKRVSVVDLSAFTCFTVAVRKSDWLSGDILIPVPLYQVKLSIEHPDSSPKTNSPVVYLNGLRQLYCPAQASSAYRYG